MKKRGIFLLTIALGLGFGGYKLHQFNQPRNLHARPCPFCKEEVFERQGIATGNLTRTLYDHHPISDGHCLVIPQRHIERFEDITAEELTEVGNSLKQAHRAAQKAFDVDNYVIIQNNGNTIGQTVPHIHFHYIPRKRGETSMIAWHLQFIKHIFTSPLSDKDLEKPIQALRESYAA